jgi:integral membrane protein (TIGR01906 family)
MKAPTVSTQRVLGWLVAILVPVALLLTSARLMLTPAFVAVEYRMPGFPEDPYGLTQEQRLEYAPIALEFLLNGEGIDFLADLRFADGSPLFEERELSHMVDVKVLTQQLLAVWYGLLVVLLGLGVWAWRADWLPVYRRMLSRGGQFTAGLILLLLLYVALNFQKLFVAFHRIFFEGDTWLFSFSDTLIRLFPMRFWQDVFIFLGLVTLLGAGLLWWQGRAVRD